MVKATFPAQVSYLRDAASFLEHYLNKYPIPPKVIQQLSVAMEEIFVNVSSYSYPYTPGNVCLRLAYDKASETIMLQIIDDGIPFDPLKKPDPDTSLSVEDRPIGGLGIFMVKKTMDDVSYEYKDGQNILTLIKEV